MTKNKMNNKVSSLAKLRWRLGIFRPQEVQDFMEISYTKGLKDGFEKGKAEAAETMSSKTLDLAEKMLDNLVGKDGAK